MPKPLIASQIVKITARNPANFCQHKTIAAIKAPTASTIQVIGLASNATVQAHVAAITPPSAGNIPVIITTRTIFKAFVSPPCTKAATFVTFVHPAVTLPAINIALLLISVHKVCNFVTVIFLSSVQVAVVVIVFQTDITPAATTLAFVQIPVHSAAAFTATLCPIWLHIARFSASEQKVTDF